MRNFKKFLTLVLAVMMVVSSFAFSANAASTKFEDVDASNETLVKAVDLLAYMGVAKGTSETTFGADELVTRQQFALFIYRLMKGGKDAPKGASNTTKFTDLEDSTYFYAISWANAEGIVNGKSATSFGPKDPIKLKEAYAMIVRALDWEEENDLVYPYGHIEVAEQDGVNLDEGLDSAVGYEDELTRGDMAILLYNAFFAEMGIEEVSITEKKYENAGWQIVETVTNPVLCEKAFDVVEVEYKAVATPHYTDGSAEATYDLGYDAIYFDEVTEESTDAPQNVYLTAEEIGLDAAELDNYFLGEFTMFVTLDKDNDIDKVLFADCNMTKKTVTDLKLGEVSTNKASSYFAESDRTAKLLSGKLVADGTEEMYVYNAPFTYANGTYGTGADAYSKYATRNEENLEAISFERFEDGENVYFEATVVDMDDADAIVTYPEKVLVSGTEGDDDAKYDVADDLFLAQAEELLAYFVEVYYDGLYEADLYDVNGDGIYDYINYKPYMFFQVDSDEDEEFGDSDFTASVPYIYTNEAVVSGVEFEDEDYVIGYFVPELEVVKVVAVVEPVEADVTGRSLANGTLTLSNGDKVDGVSAWKLFNQGVAFTYADVIFDEDAVKDSIVYNADGEPKGLFADAELSKVTEREFYIYDGVLLHTTGVESNTVFDENLIIPTLWVDEDGATKPVKEAPFNPDADNEVYYVYAWVDGVNKYVQVELNDELTPWVVDNGELNANYVDVLCTYTVSNDIYTITPLATDILDEDGDVDSEAMSSDFDLLGEGDEEGEEDAQILVNLGNVTDLTREAGYRFDIGADRDVIITDNTKIIIRTVDDKYNYDYVEYTKADMTKTLEGAFTNVQAIIANNVDSTTRENLLVLYAEVDEDSLGFKGTKDKNGYRIVSGYDVAQDEDGYWRNFYKLYDPFTGASTGDAPSVPSKDYDKKSNGLNAPITTVGTVVELVDGMVDEDEVVKTEAGDALVMTEAPLVWISDFDTTDGCFKVTPFDGHGNLDVIEEYVETYEDAAAEDVYGKVIGSNYIDVDKDTVVSVISSTQDNLWRYGSMSLTTVDALAKAGKDLRSYNEYDLNPDKANASYVTTYADYVTAYVSVDYNVDSDENPVAEFIIIVVNSDVDEITKY